MADKTLATFDGPGYRANATNYRAYLISERRRYTNKFPYSVTKYCRPIGSPFFTGGGNLTQMQPPTGVNCYGGE